MLMMVGRGTSVCLPLASTLSRQLLGGQTSPVVQANRLIGGREIGLYKAIGMIFGENIMNSRPLMSWMANKTISPFRLFFSITLA